MYEIEITPENQRVSFIAEKQSQSQDIYKTWDVYPNREETLRIVILPVGMPIFRMANGRTASEQFQLIQDLKLGDEYFLNGQENEEVQQKQHDMLVKLSKQSADGSGDSIYDVLAKNPQKEPLLIAPNGVVLNGNRRLAAMRDIYSENPGSYSQFSHVICAVLPKLTPQQEIDLELKLQMSQNFKLEYSWVDEALMIDNAKRFHSVDELMAMMNKSKQHLNMMTRALAEAQLYLIHKEKKPHSYGLVQNKFQLFKDLQKFTKEVNEDRASAIRHIAWYISDVDLEDRLYSYNFILSDRSEDFVTEVLNQIDTESLEPIPQNDNLSISLNPVVSDYDRFNAWVELNSQDNTSSVVNIIEGTAEKLKADEDAKRTGQDPLKLAIEIHTKLEKLDVTKASNETQKALIVQLEQIRDKAANMIRISNS
jgi:hypothetical protein